MQKLNLCISILILAATVVCSTAKRKCDSCYKSSKVLPSSITEREAGMQARCLSTCVDKPLSLTTMNIFNECSYQLSSYCPSYTHREPNLQGQWYSMNFIRFFDNCTAYQMILDCQRGCNIQSTNSNLTYFQCGSQCIAQCPNSTKYQDTTCNVNCDHLVCQYGCEIYVNELMDTNVSNLTDVKLPPPILASYDLEGRLVYNVALPSNNTMDSELMTAFIFKITTVTNNSYYIWKETISGYLDLKYFMCENVQISYKAITHKSATNYSYDVAATVNGLKIPEQYPAQVDIDDIETYFQQDGRENYAHHAIATFSWKPPENAEFLGNYRLTVFSQIEKCGGIGITTSYCINKNATNFTIVASSLEEPLVFQCKYFVRLISEPTKLNDTDMPYLYVNIESVSDPPPKINIHCGREYQNNGKLTIYAIWSIPDTPGLLDAIGNYSVTPQKIEMYNNRPEVVVEYYTRIFIFPHVNHTLNVAYVKNLLPLQNKQTKYRMRVDAISNHKFPWRRMPIYSSCNIDGHPEAPSLINSSNIIIHYFSIKNRDLYLNVSWQYPPIPNGNITMFTLRLSHSPLPSETSYTKDIPGIETEAVIDTDAVYKIEEISCIYLQIRSKNNYLWSNWSDPVPLSRYSQDPFCESSYIPVATPTTTVSENAATNNQVLGGVIGTITAVLLLVVLCTATAVLCRRYHRRNRYLDAFKDVHTEAMYIRGPMSPVPMLSNPLCESPKFDDWEIPASQVMIEKRLGEGCFGEVYQGIIKGPISNPKVQASLKNIMCPIVAIKLLKQSATGSEKVDFLQEIETMKNVSRGNNPHVVNMVGCVTIQEPLCLITEFIKHGDLLSYLQSIRKMVTTKSPVLTTNPIDTEIDPYTITLNDDQDTSSNDSPVDKRKSIAMPHPESEYADLGGIEAVNLLSFAYQIASGMEFLASLGIVHRDLACRNILVDEGKSLKISDFGMSRTLTDNDVYVKNTRGRLPWKWMAIESIVNREFTTASDVWAYGVTLWEIATLGGFPYPMISNNQLLEHLQKGYRLDKPDNCSQDVYEIMLECWMSDPHSRPTFSSLRAKFDNLISSQQGHVPYIDLDIDSCKPYYATLDNEFDDEQKRASSESSEVSTESSSLPRVMDGYDMIRSNTTDELPRPVSNAYVDTPTKVNPYESPFYPGDPCPSVLDSPLKKELKIAEVA